VGLLFLVTVDVIFLSVPPEDSSVCQCKMTTSEIRKMSFDLCSNTIHILLLIYLNLTVSWLIIPFRQYTHCIGWQLHIFHSVRFPILSRNMARFPNQFVLRICKGPIYLYPKVRSFFHRWTKDNHNLYCLDLGWALFPLEYAYYFIYFN